MKEDYRKYYIENFKTPEEAESMRVNAEDFSSHLIIEPEIAAPLFQWHCNFYFYGLDENSETCIFKQDVERHAKAGITKLLLIDTTEKGEASAYSPYCVMTSYFRDPYNFDKKERDIVINILEKIKLKTPFCFKRVDWDYFLTRLWWDTINGIFEAEFEDEDMIDSSFIYEQIEIALDNLGLDFEEFPRSRNTHCGFGIDFGKYLNCGVITMSE